MLLSVLISIKFCASAPLQPWLHRLINSCCMKIKVLTLYFFFQLSSLLLFSWEQRAVFFLPIYIIYIYNICVYIYNIYILVFYRPLSWASCFLSRHTVFPEFLRDLWKPLFFPFSSAFQYSPGPILKKVQNVSDKYKPPIKKLHYCIIQTVPHFLFMTVQYFIQVLLTLGKSTTKTEAWLSSAWVTSNYFSYHIILPQKRFLIIFLCSFCWHGVMVCQSKPPSQVFI